MSQSKSFGPVFQSLSSICQVDQDNQDNGKEEADLPARSNERPVSGHQWAHADLIFVVIKYTSPL